MNFKIIVITPDEKVKNEISAICGLFKAGLKILHIRKPNFTKAELKAYLQKIPKKYHKRIILHSHYRLAKEFNLKGIHLTEKTKRLAKFNSGVKIISASFHTTKDIFKSRRNYEYIFLSPVFDSISKKSYKAKFILENLKSVLIKKNIIALGGITSENIRSVKKMGFAGAAALGFIWEKGIPEKNYKKLFSKIK